MLLPTFGACRLSEIAVPYVVFVSNGYDVTLASTKGGQVGGALIRA
jgi:putative intracellular protease/amidase